jgi:hypothetical protein
MLGLAIILTVWFVLGTLGARLAYKGSMRRYGKDIYGPKLYAGVVLGGFSGFVGSSVAW